MSRPLSCEQAEEARLAAASGPLEGDLACALETHLAACDRCRSFAEDIERLERGLRATLALASGPGGAAERFLAAARESASLPRAADRSPASAHARVRALVRRLSLAAAAVLLAGAAWSYAARRRLPPARVEWGMAEIARGASTRPAAPRLALATGDVVTTGERAAVLALGEGAEATLGPRTRLRLAGGPRRLALEAGTASFRVPHGGGAFEVETALGTISDLGTEFTIELLESGSGPGGATQRGSPVGVDRRLVAGGGALALAVGVISGAVLLRTPAGDRHEVGAGQVAFADAAGAVEVRRLDDLRREAASSKEQVARLEEALKRADGERAALAAKVEAFEERERASALAAANARPASPEAATPSAEASADTGTGGVDAALAKKNVEIAALIKGIDWKEATRAIVAYNESLKHGRQVPLVPKDFMALSKLNLAAGKISELLGKDDPTAAYQDPRVRDQFVPAWLDACGASLDDQQAEALRAHIAAQELKAVQATEDGKELRGADSESFLDHTLKSIRHTQEQEEFLETLLRPDQQSSYAGTVGDDPLYGMTTRNKGFRATGEDRLVDTVATAWQGAFQLSDASRDAVRPEAQRYVAGALAVPALDATLAGMARRKAVLARAEHVLTLQRDAEAEVARDPSLTEDERGRAAQGAGFIIDVSISR